MKLKSVLFIVILGLSFAVSAFAQDESDSTEFNWHRWRHEHFDWKMFRNEFKGDPTISLRYGFSQMSLRDMNDKFADPGMMEIKLGYTRSENYDHKSCIIDYNYRGAALSYFSTDVSGNTGDPLKYESNTWRFGLSRAYGYGYKLGKAAVIPYYGYSVDWTRMAMNNSLLTQVDKNLIEPFDGTVRFGTSTEAGIKIRLVHYVELNASYERSVVFRRHLFWKWLGSTVIESAGQVAIDRFVDEIMDSTPYAGPIVSFVLKNALSYGVYELRQEKMNWPFRSEPPLSYDQFKVGINFVF